ncbi:phenylacetaldehyde reductase isoform X2 [Cryptomeria japonica]|uniref:phenylacetaldehyde reductase isoform X2 n=1 Tax=Cryptomeria japonica TaxID=3369 RepID=UPI0025AC40DB|nr:phenylacetaldehyde reductase isoform X2 [Cryptomeria japonica]
MTGKLVCVTGASGFVASWIVKLLLNRGYVVRATVRDLGNPDKTKHLSELEGANERLHLVKADLLDMGSFEAAIDSCEGVFHTASPFYFDVKDPQAELLEPAVTGVINVLEACAKTPSVKRVVITSSIAAVAYNVRTRGPDVVVDETWFSDPEYLREQQNWYQLSKTLAEETAWKMAKDKGIDIVTINPGMVIGPLLQPTLNTSCAAILQLMNGSSTYPNSSFGWVSVVDVAEAHILAFEVPSANGRCVDDKPFVPTYKVSKEKVEKLGLEFTSIEEVIKQTIESLKEKKMLKLESNL